MVKCSAASSRLSARTIKIVARLVLLMLLSVFGFGCNTASSTASTTSPNSRLNANAWPASDLTIANLGHATLLMNFFGVRVISDPTLFNRVGIALDSLVTFGRSRLCPRT
jgi:hypothetical protein